MRESSLTQSEEIQLDSSKIDLIQLLLIKESFKIHKMTLRIAHLHMYIFRFNREKNERNILTIPHTNLYFFYYVDALEICYKS